jgi:hypothetical protein
LCRDPRLSFLYDPGKNAWTGTDDAWANKAVAEIARKELIANLQNASCNDAFQYLHSHLSGFPTYLLRVRTIRNAILAKLNVPSRKRKVDERCEQLAKQIVGMIGRKARTILNPACNIEHFLRTRLGGRFSELEKLPSQPNLYRLRAPI